MIAIRCILAAAWLLITSQVFAQTRTRLEGVWRITEVVTPAGNPAARGVEVRTTDRKLPSVLIFTRGYYSQVYENRPRAATARPQDPQNPTDAEKLALYEQWRPFTANSGTYVVDGSTLTFQVVVAKNVESMNRPPNRWQLKFEGPDGIWLIPSAERAATEPKMKLTRLE